MTVEPWIRVRCPFCFTDGPRYKFERILKSGKVASKVTCPSCNSVFYRNSNVNDKTAAQFAQWIIDYPSGAYWAKADFDKLKAFLKAYGIGTEFWDAYKAGKDKATEQYQADRAARA